MRQWMLIGGSLGFAGPEDPQLAPSDVAMRLKMVYDMCLREYDASCVQFVRTERRIEQLAGKYDPSKQDQNYVEALTEIQTL